MSNQSVHDEVCDLLPNELYLIVLDYMGNGRFWKHIFNRCLLKVEERIRGDDTAQSY